MKQHLRSSSPILVAMGLAAGGCQSASTTVPDPDLGEDAAGTVTLGVGQTTRFDGVDILFWRVSEDSRCPTDVTCVWSGNGVVLLQVFAGHGPADPVTLNTHIQPRASVSSGLRIRLVDLEPHPVSTASTDPDAYRVELEVAAAETPH